MQTGLTNHNISRALIYHFSTTILISEFPNNKIIYTLINFTASLLTYKQKARLFIYVTATLDNTY